MIKYLLSGLFLVSCFCTQAQQEPALPETPYEKSAGQKTATWGQCIKFYKKLDSLSDNIKMIKAGKADGNYPLHVVYFSADGNFNPDAWRKEGRIIFMVNNAIHPGEPDGVDASMMLLRDAAAGKTKIPVNVVLAVIPIYNIGGALNRGSYSRANQNGPEAYGFRGNGQNLDLNRDFIKCDAAETRTLEHLFTTLDPDIFIDNHVSDGADYQHIMTLLPTQHDKAGGKTGALMYRELTPALYKRMKGKGYTMAPYVNNFDNTPEKGWTEFFESPRFASGYTALFQTVAWVPETHMLKPFKQRVEATYALMRCMIDEAAASSDKIKSARAADRQALMSQKQFVLDWKVDSTQTDKITFMGYRSAYKASEVSGLPRLYYDRQQPFTAEVPFYNHYLPARTVSAPEAYILPRSWNLVVNRLKCNGVAMQPLKHDTTITVTAYTIGNYETVPKPYERHYLHKNVQVTATTTVIKFKKGDLLIRLNQPAKRYLVETLEPTGPDAFFAWNFFDGILSQKEYFGDYIFEDLAAELLRNDEQLRRMLEEKKKNDKAFAASASAQLDFVYRHSPYMEPGYMRYPVYRIE
jgi:hypothetical protein